jgi:hypothetical protein
VGTCVEFLPAGIETAVKNPTSDAAGILFDVGFRVTNGCGQFDSLEQNKIGSETTVKVIAKYEGCVCAEDAPPRETVYSFYQAVPGPNALKFLNSTK